MEDDKEAVLQLEFCGEVLSGGMVFASDVFEKESFVVDFVSVFGWYSDLTEA